jgi:hypothetical protein
VPLGASSLPCESRMFDSLPCGSTRRVCGLPLLDRGHPFAWGARGPGEGAIVFACGTRTLGRLPASSISLARRTDPFLSASLGSGRPCESLRPVSIFAGRLAGLSVKRCKASI